MAKPFHALAKWVDDHLLLLLTSFVSLGLAAVVLWPYSVINIPAGHLGVLWSRFGGGTVLDRVYHEGINVILPWDEMTLYDVRLQRTSETFHVLAANSLNVAVHVDFVYRPDEANLPLLHRYVGPDYAHALLEPMVGFETRNVFAAFTPDSGFTSDRRAVANEILRNVSEHIRSHFNAARGTVQTNYIFLDDVLINSITLPPIVAEAVDKKNAMREQVGEFGFRVQVEQREAERKAVEARGIRQFHEDVGDALTDNYLRLRAIDAMLEATREIAKSPGSKMFIMGGSPGGLPLVLGPDGMPLLPPRSPALSGTAPTP
jgi:regulator of protease activity HflC (stomatin/prohibitin superfamily)